VCICRAAARRCRAVVKKVDGDEAVLEVDMKGVERLPLKMLAPESDFGDSKQKKLKAFNAVTRTDLKRILMWSGYKVHGQCEGDEVQNETKEGTMIYSLNIAAGFRLMQMSLDLKEEDFEFVHPDLWKTYMEGKKGVDTGADEAFVEQFMKGQVRRAELLKKKLDASALQRPLDPCSGGWKGEWRACFEVHGQPQK
jgi:hypothetical protein